MHNDYVELTVPRLMPLVHPGARVLEIGPGSGAFTLPLARISGEVVAVEPSAYMRTVLSRNLAAAEVENVHIVGDTIEEAIQKLDGVFDLAFASYSLYNVESMDMIIRDLVGLARHVVLLMGTGEKRAWYQLLYRRFCGKDPASPPQYEYLYPLLLEMGIYADVQIYHTSHNYVFDSEDALFDWWQRQFHVSETDRGSLQAALSPLIEHRGPLVGIYARRRTALVWIEQKRSLAQ
jgi:SAM-dependent methyltransferase